MTWWEWALIVLGAGIYVAAVLSGFAEMDRKRHAALHGKCPYCGDDV